jgi:hypothetical protein
MIWAPAFVRCFGGYLGRFLAFARKRRRSGRANNKRKPLPLGVLAARLFTASSSFGEGGRTSWRTGRTILRPAQPLGARGAPGSRSGLAVRGAVQFPHLLDAATSAQTDSSDTSGFSDALARKHASAVASAVLTRIKNRTRWLVEPGEAARPLSAFCHFAAAAKGEDNASIAWGANRVSWRLRGRT